MIAEIISVGTELLLGQIVDTNRTFVAKKITEKGIETYYQSIVGDNLERLEEALTLADTRADLIILIGGLGPTKDDLTKQATAQHLGVGLATDDEALNKVVKWHQNSGVPMAKNNRLQAQYLEGGHPIENDVGFAVGSFYEDDDETHADYLLLPGPPWELEPMFDKYVQPFLNKSYFENQIITSRVLRYYGIGESRLSTILDDLIENQTNPTIATYIKRLEPTIRITANGTDQEEVDSLLDEGEEKINALVGDYFYGYGDNYSLEEAVYDLLRDRGLTLCSVELGTNELFKKKISNVDRYNKIYLELFEGFMADVAVYESVDKVSDEDKKREVAETLADLTRKLSGADICVFVFGSDGDVEDIHKYQKEPFQLAFSRKGQETVVYSRVYAKDHLDNQERAVYDMFDIIRRQVLGLKELDRK
ncbi:CinA family nicotinamide mononucleotide deamidase-related protein [Floricoccus penangensis]|uniref:CinA family nicotinamide mononucleotide deamidase-related protein n=1 Tax=Floricoccus penangensis TaxID=1859475 RepID=UPI002040E3C5|nr:CinA family nicotinamide mononucleotide deamidase-related protein [Floricoccus penangensis]URZ87110.1 CinA family nicotinamide mononucleotide deamidase-related protein [Floricoccus penangensis]